MSRDLIAQRKGYFMTNYRKLFTYLPIIPVFGISMNNIKNKLSKKIDIPR